MLPSRSLPARRARDRRHALAALVSVLLLFHASAALALEVAVSRPHEAGGYVWTDVVITDPFAIRVEESLSRGMPATLDLHAELWRRRSSWFDRLENSADASIKIRYEVWSRTYRLQRRGAPDRVVADLESVRDQLSGPMAIPVARLEELKEGARYYLVVTVTLKPLSVEDVEEGEGWLSGEVQTNRRSGVGVITAIPRSLFDAMRNFAGFGDQRARAITKDFLLENLRAH